MLNDDYTQEERDAFALGVEHAKNAASWTVDGNTSQEHIRRVLTMLEDGDPAVEAYLPREPNLSGYAQRPYARILGVPDHRSGQRRARLRPTVDALADAYEAGVSETFQSECERELRNALNDKASS